MKFLRNLLATLTGLFIFSFLALSIVIGIATAASDDEAPAIEDNSVLKLNLTGILRERADPDPFDELFPGNTLSVLGLKELKQVIEKAKYDDNIRGIYIKHMYLSSGYAMLNELRDAILDFKQSGKFVYSYGEFISERDYYVATASDKIFLQPQGNLEFNGLTANVTFLKGMFDKLEIEPEVFRVGSYKSAIEPLIRKDLSEENKFQLQELLTSLNNTYLDKASESLNIPLPEITDIQNQMKAQTPEEAEELKLITKVAYEDEVLSAIADAIEEEDAEDVEFTTYKSYKKSLSMDDYSENKIAVIVGEGSIVTSGDPNENIIGEKYAQEIRKARARKSVKAIILRINSPGGSLTASDMIWREVEQTRGVKPIIASMSDVAASGGYYMAMACDTIMASPNTITGSIGIFSVLFNFEKFLNNKMGITNDGVSTGEYSDILTVTRALNPDEKAIIQKAVDRGYETFVTKVAEGRDMSKERVDELGGGRVWTGAQALSNGLVDVLGGLKEAIEIAAEAAEIGDDYRVVFYPKQKTLFEEVITVFSEEVSINLLGSEVRHSLQTFKDIKAFALTQGLQARMPGEIEVH